ncbi:uncharacterized protein LOC115290709 [Suricata suricatta]|uniref:uncharacterized protein LOC115290709 n=1 Tax=Suricata suricatta TaxID=37032 RepID=UPI0011559C88|nr:uncharacterized protein LOC115290709 [Suricata suricatta]
MHPHCEVHTTKWGCVSPKAVPGDPCEVPNVASKPGPRGVLPASFADPEPPDRQHEATTTATGTHICAHPLTTANNEHIHTPILSVPRIFHYQQQHRVTVPRGHRTASQHCERVWVPGSLRQSGPWMQQVLLLEARPLRGRGSRKRPSVSLCLWLVRRPFTDDPSPNWTCRGREPDPSDRRLPPSDKWDPYVHLCLHVVGKGAGGGAELAPVFVFRRHPARSRGFGGIYLAFLSPRVRVRHWGDEGQGKGAEGGWRRERGEASSPRRCWPQWGWGAQGDFENPVAVVAAAATQDGAVLQDQNLEAARSEVKPAQPCSSALAGGSAPAPNHRELRPYWVPPRRAGRQAPPPLRSSRCRFQARTGDSSGRGVGTRSVGIRNILPRRRPG